MSKPPILEAPTTSLRLTPRGLFVIRLLLICGILAALGIVITTLVFHQPIAPAAASGEQPTGRYQEVVVQPGDTLWEISSRVAQNGERVTVFEQIMTYNDLKTSELEVGQTLYIPVNENDH